MASELSKQLRKRLRWKYKVGQLLYFPNNNAFAIICGRITRAYGIHEYYIKPIDDKGIVLTNYYYESEVKDFVRNYEELVK